MARGHKSRNDIPSTLVKKLLNYSPESGIFRWKRQSDKPRWWNTKFAGKIAGCKGTLFILIRVEGTLYTAHRLAWLYTYGEWPISDIDHIDGNPFNNALNNLRRATPSENQCNRGAQRGNRSGYKGVTWHGNGAWVARICLNRKTYHLGSFHTPEAAHEAYKAAAIRLHEDFARFS